MTEAELSTLRRLASGADEFHRLYKLMMAHNFEGIRNAVESASSQSQDEFYAGKRSDFFQSLVTCLAFSAELYIKAGLFIEGKDQWGHKLDKLFAQLDPDTSSSILARMNEVLHLRDTSFEEQLNAMANAFTDWRYLHEQNDVLFPSRFAEALTEALAEHVHAQVDRFSREIWKE